VALVCTKLKNYPPSLQTADFQKFMAISGIMKIRDSYTETHGRRVSIYAKRLATRIGLSSMAVDEIAVGGILHDIGKVCMSDRMFTNQDVHMSQEMMAELRRHPINGFMLVKSIVSHKTVLQYILFHHERLDGRGYPFGLKGDDIPLGAQIISVADCFDAITTDRPYKKGKGQTEAFSILKASAGSALSQSLVNSFILDIQENGMLLTED
jgi:HD-GYP domain-containing protein (c-di-GMP phosphodiesterase class II)